MRRIFSFPVALATVIATVPGAAQATSTTCSTSTVCAEYINTYSGTSGGVAIHGEANSGIGVRGTSVTNTGFYGASGSGSMTAPGVEGESTNNNGTDTGGGFGLVYLTGGTAPSFGVLGYGSLAGVGGVMTTAGATEAKAGGGVLGVDEAKAATYNFGVAGVSQYGTGGLFEADASPTLSYFGQYPIGLYAVGNSHTTGGEAFGLVAESPSYALFAKNTTSGGSIELGNPNQLFYAYTGSGTKDYFYIDNDGSAYLSGTIQTKNGTYARKGGSGAIRTAYGSESTSPDIEDVGEATLVNGRATVTLDSDLADSIDMHRAYHVFLTPDGDCNQLYVAQRAPSGFVVRESHGGRSNLTFEYRIVAKPFDESGIRLARATASAVPHHPLRSASIGAPSPAIESPEARLKERLGERGYAKLIAELSRRITGR